MDHLSPQVLTWGDFCFCSSFEDFSCDMACRFSVLESSIPLLLEERKGRVETRENKVGVYG